MNHLRKISAPLFLLIFFAFSTNAQAQFWKRIKGNGNVTTETRSVSDFNKLSAGSGIDVIYTNGAQSVKVIADENIIDHIITEVKGNELIIKRKNKINISWSKKMEVQVSAPTLTAVSVSSGADFLGKDKITTKNFSLSSSSGADVNISVNASEISINNSSGADINAVVNAKQITVDAGSGADISLQGSANNAVLSASSGADIEAYNLAVESCEANASSAGDIEVTVSKSLQADASSGGDISYQGNPATVDESSSSGGDVTRE